MTGGKRGAKPGGIAASRARASAGLGVDGTTLTPERHASIVAVLRTGGYMVTAAAISRVPIRTVDAWLTEGRREREGRFARFVADCDEAESAGEHERVERIRAAGEAGDWKADAWHLERRAKERWRHEQRTEVAGSMSIIDHIVAAGKRAADE